MEGGRNHRAKQHSESAQSTGAAEQDKIKKHREPLEIAFSLCLLAAVAALAAMYAAASKQLHQYSLRPLGLFQLTEGIGKGYFHTGTPFGSF